MKRSRIKQVNHARLRALRGKQFGGAYREWIIRQPCAFCQIYVAGVGSQPAHMKSRGSGGTAEHVLPLCHFCHREQEEHQNSFAVAFALRYDMSVFEAAEAYYSAFHGEIDAG